MTYRSRDILTRALPRCRVGFWAGALALLRQRRRLAAVCAVILAVGCEVVAVAMLSTQDLPARDSVVRFVLAGHAAVALVVVATAAWVARSVRRAEERAVLEMTLLVRMQQQRQARPSFRVLGPSASQRIARMFRWVLVRCTRTHNCIIA